MRSRFPGILLIIVSLLFLFALIGGCTFGKMNPAVEPAPYETDAWCEIQEFNLTVVHNQTIVPVTEEDLKPFPEFGIYLMDLNNSPPTGNTGTRVFKVIDCNSSRAIQFLTLYRKYEEFPDQPVLEYRGRFYEMGFEYLESHSTARPTISVG
jgi:hypothetical protein